MSVVFDPRDAVPDLLYIITGSDKQVYYFDTQFARASNYLRFLSKRVPDLKFTLSLEDKKTRLEELWG